MAKHFVTGAAGFLGSQIVDKLHAMGERDIVAFDILDCNVMPEGVTRVRGSVLDKDLLLRITEGADYIHHNAALVPLTKSGTDFHAVNVIGTRNIVECCKTACGEEAHSYVFIRHLRSSGRDAHH